MRTLLVSPSFTVRQSASILAGNMGILPAVLPHFELSPIYELELPPISEPDHHLPSSVYAAGRVSPETEDHWEWVVTIHDEIKVLSKLSSIPMQNLVERIASLMREIQPRDTWSPDAELKRRDKLEKIGLKLSYTRVRSEIATRALAFVLAELLDARRIPSDLASTLRARIDPWDVVAMREQPITRPVEVQLPTRRDMDQFRREDWEKAAHEALPRCIERFSDGRIVIAELTRIRRWGTETLTETRASCWMASRRHSEDNAYRVSGIFPDRTWWRLDEYPELVGADTSWTMALHLSPVFVRGGCCEWLVPNPVPCQQMGWQLIGLRKWAANGDTKLETVWWTEGPGPRADVHNNEITAEGWLILATPEAASTLAARVPCIVRKRVERRVGRDAFGAESDGGTTAESTIDPTAVLA